MTYVGHLAKLLVIIELRGIKNLIIGSLHKDLPLHIESRVILVQVVVHLLRLQHFLNQQKKDFKHCLHSLKK